MVIFSAFIRTVALLGALPFVASAQASGSSIDEPTKLVGVFNAGATGVSFESAPMQWRRLFGFRMSHRWAATRRLRVGPQISLNATDLRGMNVEKDPFAFFYLDAGVEASLRVATHLRPYLHVRTGERSAEYVDQNQVWNFSGSGMTFGGGIEVPITTEGRGLDIGVNRIAGTLTKAELLKSERPVHRTFRAWSFVLGWGGPLTIRPPWK